MQRDQHRPDQDPGFRALGLLCRDRGQSLRRGAGIHRPAIVRSAPAHRPVFDRGAGWVDEPVRSRYRRRAAHGLAGIAARAAKRAGDHLRAGAGGGRDLHAQGACRRTEDDRYFAARNPDAELAQDPGVLRAARTICSIMTPPVLEVAGLSVRFGGLVAVDNVSLAIPASSIHGLIGPNGAGKTTFFNAITGLVRPSQGSVAVLGQDITHKTADRRAAAGIRRTFQSVQLITPLTVLENVLIGLHTRLFTNAKGLLGCLGAASERAAQQSVLEILEFLGIAHIILKPVTEITFAEQRFVEIARALVAKPVLLMVDEPAAGLSPQEIETLDRLLRKLRDEWGMSILLVEHVLSLIMGVSDRVTVLDNGRLIAEGAPMQVAGDPKVKAAYLGQD